MKRYRITNKLRFITFCTVLILITVFAAGSLLGLYTASGSDQLAYVSVKVQSGDTIWDLAGKYGPQNADRRAVVYEICSLNGVTASTLRPGQYLTIPSNSL